MHSIKILVVEDFEGFRRFVCSALQQRPEFQVTQASDELEAVQRAEELQPDLILLDLGLPKLNGIEVARRVRTLAPAAKILFFGVESDPDVVRRQALSLGAGYIHKLRFQSDLLPAIEAVLRGEQFVSRDLGLNGRMDAPRRHEKELCTTVLLVDDFVEFRAAASALLRKKPELQIIAEASDGVEAVEKSRQLQPDLILLDIGLPQLNGIEAAKQISKVAPHSKILFVSQETDPDVVEIALGLGAGYVSKSCIQRDLLPAVESVQRFIGNGQDDSTDKGNAQATNWRMPYRFEFDSKNSILHGCFEGFVSKRELRNYYQTAVKHVARLSPNSYVVDVSAVTSTTVSTGTILEFAKLPPVLPGAQHHLIAVAAHPAAFWLMRMYAAAVRTSRPNLHVVNTHAEAWAILGISEPRFNPLPDHAVGEA